MAKWDFKGLDTYISQLQKIEEVPLGPVVYEGAKVVADSVKAGLESIPVDNRRYVKDMRTSITQEQKHGLIDGFGISMMQNRNGFVNVKLGFDGYNDFHTNAYPNGQPNLMVARALTSGTSFLPKNDIIQKSVSAVKKRCEEVMREHYDSLLNKEIE